jgi:hypothetical protein
MLGLNCPDWSRLLRTIRRSPTGQQQTVLRVVVPSLLRERALQHFNHSTLHLRVDHPLCQSDRVGRRDTPCSP